MIKCLHRMASALQTGPAGSAGGVQQRGRRSKRNAASNMSPAQQALHLYLKHALQPGLDHAQSSHLRNYHGHDLPHSSPLPSLYQVDPEQDLGPTRPAPLRPLSQPDRLLPTWMQANSDVVCVAALPSSSVCEHSRSELPPFHIRGDAASEDIGNSARRWQKATLPVTGSATGANAEGGEREGLVATASLPTASAATLLQQHHTARVWATSQGVTSSKHAYPPAGSSDGAGRRRHQAAEDTRVAGGGRGAAAARSPWGGEGLVAEAGGDDGTASFETALMQIGRGVRG